MNFSNVIVAKALKSKNVTTYL